MAHVFIAGGTGYIGQRLIPRLVHRGHTVRALVRPGSEERLPKGTTAVSGNALDANTFADQVAPADTFVQLVGVPHPSPAKAAQFRAVDLVSGKASIAVAAQAGVRHYIYVSVARPAPMMHAYIAVRSECEECIRAAGLNATILRPWYVLGPGHVWPYALVPFYWLAERISATRDGARRLGLVTLDQMVTALSEAVEQPAEGIRVVQAVEINERRPT